MPKTEPTADAKLLADKIERDGLCTICDYHHDDDPKGPSPERDLIVDALRRYVNAGWIKTSERTPDSAETVLIYQGDAGSTRRTAFYSFKKWAWSDPSYEHPCKPEAWMPIPAYISHGD